MATSNSVRRTKVLKQMATGIGIISLPVSLWWYRSNSQRNERLEAIRTKIRLPQITDNRLEECRPGDVIVFDRRCETCACGPWAALACYASRHFLCDNHTSNRHSTTTYNGNFHHVGLIVPGFSASKAAALDPTNLLLLEATPRGIVARPLEERLEASNARSALLLRLAAPGERRLQNDIDNDDHSPQRAYLERELRKFRNQWLELGQTNSYQYMHSTLTLGGALLAPTSIQQGPTSPSAYLVLLGLQQGAVAVNIRERDNLATRPQDFLGDYRFSEQDAVPLRPGWRFLPPLALIETTTR